MTSLSLLVADRSNLTVGVPAGECVALSADEFPRGLEFETVEVRSYLRHLGQLFCSSTLGGIRE